MGLRIMGADNVIEMLHITKEFPGIIANQASFCVEMTQMMFRVRLEYSCSRLL